MATPSAPRFLKPIPTKTTCALRSVGVLEVFLKGRPIPSITWHKNGTPVDVRDKYQMHFEDTGRCSLIIDGVDEDDEGEYECRATNCYGQVSCFGEMYVKKDASNVKVIPPSKPCRNPQSGDGECTVASEGKSGLFILIDEGSQDDENSADEMGCRESISASEQIESIIEDLTMGEGSLIGREGTFASQRDRGPPRGDDRSKYLKSKMLIKIREDQGQENDFEDVEDDRKSFKEQCPNTKGGGPMDKPRLGLQLHKAAGVEDNLHQTFDYRSDPSTVIFRDNAESARSADVVGRDWNFGPRLATPRSSLRQLCDHRGVASAEKRGSRLERSGPRPEGEGKDGPALRTAARNANPERTTSEACRCRRNTTDGVVPPEGIIVQKEKRRAQRRCSSDRKEVCGDCKHPGEDPHQQQQYPWEGGGESLRKMWKDSFRTESGDDPSSSDVEADHDEVFIEQFKDEFVSPVEDSALSSEDLREVTKD